MKLFLSWSGDLSHNVALILRDWLPCVINACEPYVSSADIDKGARWSTDIAKALEECSFGILCVTHENVDAPWLNFEAGALSKHIEKSHVCPLLYGLKKTDVTGPLLQFQVTSVEKTDVLQLLATVNKVCAATGLNENQLGYVFDRLWPDLEMRLGNLNGTSPSKVAKPTNEANRLVEEILELVRTQQKLLRSPEVLLPPEYLTTVINRCNNPTFGVPPDYPAWRELQIAIDSANIALKRFNEGNVVRLDEVQSIVSRIVDPAEILLRKTRELGHKS